MIQVKNVDFSFPNIPFRFQNLCLTVYEGEALGILGAPGSGKSTLLRLLAGELVPQKGSVLLNGEPVCRVPSEDLSKKLGISHQALRQNDRGLTVREAALAAARRGGHSGRFAEQVASFALSAIFWKEMESLPLQKLSFTQLPVVEVLCVLAAQPATMLLDDPTKMMTETGREKLISSLQTLTCCRAIASNDYELILRVCSHVVILDRGELLAYGDPQILLRSVPLLHRAGLSLPQRFR